MKKLLFVLFLIVAVVLGAAWFFLPSLVKDGLESYLHDTIPMEKVQVEMEHQNPFTLLSGEVDSISAKGEKVVLGDLTYDRVNIELKNLQFDVKQLLTDKKFIVQRIEGGNIEMSVSESALQEYLSKELSHFKNIAVGITPKQLEVAGDVNLAGLMSGRVEIMGEALLSDNKLFIHPNGLRFNSMGISGLTSQVMKPIEVYDFRKFPIPVAANKVEMKPGEVTVSATPHKE